jgi:uncharacterized protein (DUF4415 family)
MKIEKVSLILGEEAALRQQLQRDRLAVWLTELEQEQGPIEAQVIEEVRQAWPAPGEKIVRAAAPAPIVVRRNTMSRISNHPSVMPTKEEDKAITAAAKEDPDAQLLTSKQLKAMVPMRTLRGRPKSDSKKLLISVRYSPEVVAYFKATGEGWQSRMDSVLREYVERQSRRARS